MTDQTPEQASPEEQEILSQAAASPTVHKARHKTDLEHIEDDDPDDEGIGDVELNRVDLSFLINVRNVETLSEAINIAAVNLGRYGMDAFHILATDPDTGRQWIISQDRIEDADVAVERLEEALDDAED